MLRTTRSVANFTAWSPNPSTSAGWFSYRQSALFSPAASRHIFSNKARTGRYRGPLVHSNDMPVPDVTQVRPGTSVSIVLKADQRTGREVQGIVQDLLTRGNHPRGIKVRLQDGRIGRVQRLGISSTLAGNGLRTSNQDVFSSGSAGDGGGGGGVVDGKGDGPGQFQVITEGEAGYSKHSSNRRAPKYRDIRLDERSEPPRADFDLMAYAKFKEPKQGRRRNKQPRGQEDEASEEGGGSSLPPPSPSSTGAASCPICDFQGDEIAVSHHVESHFAGRE